MGTHRTHFKFEKVVGTLTVDTSGADVKVETKIGEVLVVVWADGRVNVYSDQELHVTETYKMPGWYAMDLESVGPPKRKLQ